MSKDVAIIGVGMHPYDKLGESFIHYGVHAARAALADADIDYNKVEFLAAGATLRGGYPGNVAASPFAEALGYTGIETMTCYAACASGSQALSAARDKILSGAIDCALVMGAESAPKGFFAPPPGRRPEDPNWVRFYMGVTNPAYFGVWARRRMHLYGDTVEDFANVKVKNARHGLENLNARYRKETSVEAVLASPMVSDPLQLLQICATSDGAAAVILCSEEFARKNGHPNAVKLAAVTTSVPKFASADVEMPDIATASQAADGVNGYRHRETTPLKAYEMAGIGPEDVSLAEVYDLATSLELDWYEDLHFCKRGEAAAMLRDGETTIGGRIPVNPSGGLSCFGEAVPAQAIAQVCELAWQMQGRAGARQVENAKVGITANQGLFGNASSVIVKR